MEQNSMRGRSRPQDREQFDYESELARQRQQARLEQVQRQLGRQQQVKGLAGQARQLSAQAAQQQAVDMVKKQVKKRILIWLAGVLLAILGNPITWVFLAVLFLIIFGAWCWDNKVSCTGLLGTEVFGVFWEIIKLWF